MTRPITITQDQVALPKRTQIKTVEDAYRAIRKANWLQAEAREMKDLIDWVIYRNEEFGIPISDEDMAEVERRKKRLRGVYFARCGKTVKIGYSRNVKQRIRNLQTSMSEPIELLLVVDGNKAYEKELHERYAEYHIRGEWFVFKGRIRGFVRRWSK